MWPRRNSVRVRAPANTKGRVQPLGAASLCNRAASPQNRARPPPISNRAKGAIQPWAAASTMKGSVIHQTPTAK